MPMQEAGRLLTIKLPAAQHKLTISQLNGCAGLSLTDQTSLTLLSDDAQLSAQDFLGRPVTVCISVTGQAPQYINGLVNDFKRGHLDYDGKTHYEIELRPWLYFLTYCQDARTYQHQSIPDILHSLFKRRGFHAFDLSGLKGDYPVLDYCVQYNETDLDFVSRLMAEAGIYYYVEHTESDHKLMLCDTPEMLGRDQGGIPFGHHAKDAIQNWQYTEALCTKGASSVVYDYTRPKQLIRGEAGDTQDKASLFEDTHQATNNTELTDQMTRRLRRAQLDAHIAKGSSNIAHLRPGMRFNLTDHPIEKHNQAYVIETIHFEAEDHSYRGHHKAQDQDLQRYQNQLICHPGHLAYAPKQQTKSRTTSLQSAVVTGSSNTEAYGDQYGRIKIQHHWDRHGQYNAHSSKWVRVRQMSAGKHWGTQFLPRAQEEVLVSYLNGDPNYPQVIGAVPNADHRPIFDIPKQESITGIKTHTLKNQDQTAGHQLTFDDKPQSEQLTIKSQRDLHINTKNKSQKTIGNNSTTNIHAGDWQVNLDNGEYKLISQAQIQLVCGTSEILLTPNEITVQADQIGLNTTQVVPEIKLPSTSLWSGFMAGVTKFDDTMNHAVGEINEQIIKPSGPGDPLFDLDAGEAKAVEGGAELIKKTEDLSLLAPRNFLLSKAENTKLRSMIRYLYREDAKIGNGGTADIIRHELSTGELYSRSGHIQKAVEARLALKRLIGSDNLSKSDLDIATQMRKDLHKALSQQEWDQIYPNRQSIRR